MLGVVGVGSRCVYGEPPAIHHQRTLQSGAVTASTNAPLPCCTPTGPRCCGVPGRAAGRDGTRIQRKVHSSQSQQKGSHRRLSLANAERLRKDDAQLLEFLAVAVDVG